MFGALQTGFGTKISINLDTHRSRGRPSPYKNVAAPHMVDCVSPVGAGAVFVIVHCGCRPQWQVFVLSFRQCDVCASCSCLNDLALQRYRPRRRVPERAAGGGIVGATVDVHRVPVEFQTSTQYPSCTRQGMGSQVRCTLWVAAVLVCHSDNYRCPRDL